MWRHLLFVSVLLLTTLSVSGQNLVRGLITSAEDGEPLFGVNITVKGSDKGTISDFDGQYSIEAPGDGILVFSYIGFEKREIAIDGRSIIGPHLDQ
jgi:hypothetical protein